MIQENYTIIIPLVFAFIAVLVKLVSRRDGDSAPKRNDTCIGQSLMLGALSASLVFAVNAQTGLDETINRREIAVRQALDRIKAGERSVDDEALLKQYREEEAQASKRSRTVTGCIIIAALCVMLVLLFAYLDRYHAFEVVDDSATCKTYQRNWWWWAAFNVFGLFGFVVVLFFTKSGK